jgi:hypothetical protein
VADLREVFYQRGVSRDRRPVFYLILRSVLTNHPGKNKSLTALGFRRLPAAVAADPFAALVLTVLRPHMTAPFEVVVDATLATDACLPPLAAAAQLFRLLPARARAHAVRAFIVAPTKV